MLVGGDPFYLKFWVNRPQLEQKVCYKVSLCENCQRQSYKTFIGLTIHAKLNRGGNPFYLKFWAKLTALERNCRFSNYFRS